MFSRNRLGAAYWVLHNVRVARNFIYCGINSNVVEQDTAQLVIWISDIQNPVQ